MDMFMLYIAIDSDLQYYYHAAGSLPSALSSLPLFSGRHCQQGLLDILNAHIHRQIKFGFPFLVRSDIIINNCKVIWTFSCFF